MAVSLTELAKTGNTIKRVLENPFNPFTSRGVEHLKKEVRKKSIVHKSFQRIHDVFVASSNHAEG